MNPKGFPAIGNEDGHGDSAKLHPKVQRKPLGSAPVYEIMEWLKE